MPARTKLTSRDIERVQMERDKKDPLGRRHQLPKTYDGRWYATECANWIIEHEERSFKENPSSSHIYFTAYCVLYGFSGAMEKLKKVEEQKNVRRKKV